MKTIKIKNKTVTVHGIGHIFVSGKDTFMKVWSYNTNLYSYTNSGSEIKEVSGMNLEDALMLKGMV